jgi:hypothetical protein
LYLFPTSFLRLLLLLVSHCLAAGLSLIKTPVMLQQVALVFPSSHHLWGFVREAKINYREIVTESLTLFCECADKDADLAKEKYGAMLAIDLPLHHPAP